jgi:hypothetical protein
MKYEYYRSVNHYSSLTPVFDNGGGGSVAVELFGGTGIVQP